MKKHVESYNKVNVKRKRKSQKGTKSGHKKQDCPCNICGAKFNFPWNLQTHVESVHQGITHLKCHNCDKGFHKSYVTTFQKHVKACVEKGKTEFKCDFCKVRFHTKVALARHRRRNHDVALPDNLFQCPICDKKFKKNSGLQIHLDVGHFNIYHLNCTNCGKQYHKNYIHGFKKHVEACRGEKNPGKQDLDKKKGSIDFQSSSLKMNGQHDAIEVSKSALVSSEFKKLWCYRCDLRFKDRKELYRHQKKSKACKVKLDFYTCRVCLTQFKSLQNYKLHNEQFHLGIKHLECPTCDRKYHKSRKFCYKKHVKACERNGPKTVPCPICGKKFLHEDGKRRHMNSWHRNEKVAKNKDFKTDGDTADINEAEESKKPIVISLFKNRKLDQESKNASLDDVSSSSKEEDNKSRIGEVDEGIQRDSENCETESPSSHVSNRKSIASEYGQAPTPEVDQFPVSKPEVTLETKDSCSQSGIESFCMICKQRQDSPQRFLSHMRFVHHVNINL